MKISQQTTEKQFPIDTNPIPISTKKMKITLIETFHTGSHKAWAEGLKRHSTHEIEILSMPGKYWKWRMHGGAVEMAEQFLKSTNNPDLIITTDMMDLSGFLALTRGKTHSTPIVLYFHENQLTYPWSPTDRDVIKKRDRHYCFINFTSALCADAVLFNSEFHRESFTSALPGFLKNFPDYNCLTGIDTITEKSSVMPLGLELSAFDKFNDKADTSDSAADAPIILWNHRWEYDKNPEDFFKAIFELEETGLEYRLVILGQAYGRTPDTFTEAEKRLRHRIIKYGYAESFSEYAHWLHAADILPVTSNQDFFGISIMEALYCGTIPLLPVRLTYPEIVSYDNFSDFFYRDRNELVEKLITSVKNYKTIDRQQFRQNAEKYDWGKMAAVYDREFEKIAEIKRG